MYHNAFEVKVIEGNLSSSIFCCKISEFEYNWYAKCQIWVIWKIYWCRNVFWRYVRYQLPHKVRLYFKTKKFISDDLPFLGCRTAIIKYFERWQKKQIKQVQKMHILN